MREWTKQELSRLEDVFYKYDEDNNKEVDAEELLNILKDIQLGEATAAEAQALLNEVDADQNGTLNWDEFLEVMELAERRALAMLHEAFAVFDADEDGFIDLDELKRVMTSLGMRVTNAKKMLDFADTDRDGHMSFQEFAWVLGYEGPMYDDDDLDDMQLEAGFGAPPQGYSNTSYSESGTDSDSESDSNSDDDDETVDSGTGDSSGDAGTDSGSDTAAESGSSGGSSKVVVKAANLAIDVHDVDSDSGSGSGSGSGSESESSFSVSLDSGEIAVRVRSFYLAEAYKVAILPSASIRELSIKVAKAANHFSPKLLRFYYRGLHVPTSSKSLEDAGIDGSDPVYMMYKHDAYTLDSDKVFDSDGVPQVWALFHTFLRQGKIKESDALAIVQRATTLFRSEPNMLRVRTKRDTVVVGDIHGQLHDLVSVFDCGGDMGPERNYIFMGDYVDRGYFSTEVLLVLYAAKVAWPDRVHLTRGNHEDVYIADKYGTKAEIEYKYSSKLWNAVADSFSHLPLCAVLTYYGKSFFCCHGGITDEIEELDDIERWNRHHKEIPRSGPVREITWADPEDSVRAGKRAGDLPLKYNVRKLKKRSKKAKSSYSKRSFTDGGGSHHVKGYTMDGLSTFLANTGVVGVFRGHEQKNLGPDLGNFGPRYEFPGSTTVFSAPNYCSVSANIASIVVFEDGYAEFLTYSWRLHPQYADFLSAGKKKKNKAGKKKSKSKGKGKGKGKSSSSSSSNEPPTFKNNYNHAAGERLWEVEDICVYAHYIDPTTLRMMTVPHIVDEFEGMLMSTAANNSVGDVDAEKRGWETIAHNISAVIKKSTNPSVIERLKRKSELMLQWYSGHDNFQEGLEHEEEYEKNVFSKNAPSYDDSFKAS